MYSANPMGASLLFRKATLQPVLGFRWPRSPNADRAGGGGSGLWGTPALGEQHSLHISRVLKNTSALQSFASCRTMRHGSRLLKRHEGFHMQVPLRLTLNILFVHSKRIGTS